MSEKEELLAELERISAEKKAVVLDFSKAEDLHDGETQGSCLATLTRLLEREKEIRKRLGELS